MATKTCLAILLCAGLCGLALTSEDVRFKMDVVSTHVVEKLAKLRWTMQKRTESGLSKVSTACYESMNLYNAGLENDYMWALYMADADGNVSTITGLMDGNFHALGAYDQCLAVKATNQDVFSFNLTGSPVSSLGKHNFDAKYCRLRWTENRYTSSGVSQGVCVPSTCSEAEVYEIYMSDFNIPGQDQKYVFCGGKPDLKTNTGAIISIVVLSFFGLLVLIATTFDYFTSMKKEPVEDTKGKAPLANGPLKNGIDNGAGPQHNIEISSHSNIDATGNFTNSSTSMVGTKNTIEEPGKLRQAILSFSLCKNFPMLTSTASPKGAFKVLNGLRFTAMTWIVLGHTWQLGTFVLIDPAQVLVSNFWGQFRLGPRFLHQIIEKNNLSVEIFFVLSGCLVMNSFMKTLKRLSSDIAGESRLRQIGLTLKELGLYVFHRYWRLTPVFAILIMVMGNLFIYFGEGPLFPENFAAAYVCRKNWWTNLLYVQNFVRPEEMCLGHTWYLANDFQFYLLVPFFALLFHLSPAVGGVFTFLVWNVSIAMRLILKMDDNNNWFMDIYIRPYARIGPYIIGMVTGYILNRTKAKVKIHKVWVFFGWLIAFAFAMLAVFGGYKRGCAEAGCIPWGEKLEQVYTAYFRDVFSLAIAWIIFTGCTGYGGFIGRFFSFDMWVPLSRLSYVTYLVHPIVQHVILLSRRELVYVQDITMVYLYIGNLILSLLVGIALTLVFEIPFLALEKVILPKRKKA